MFTRNIDRDKKEHTFTNYLNLQHLNLGRSQDSNQLFAVNLQVRFKTTNGQKIAVCGSIPELGLWKKFDFHLKNPKDDIWITESPLLTKKRYFQYKYVLLNQDGSLSTWERGVDRIADLDILPDIN